MQLRTVRATSEQMQHAILDQHAHLQAEDNAILTIRDQRARQQVKTSLPRIPISFFNRWGARYPP